jgi:calcineurin-like phosphoesterase
MNILFVGDVVGAPGRRAVVEALGRVIDKSRIDFTIVNIENAAGGFGLTVELFEELSKLPIDVFSSGNHIWDKKEIYDALNSSIACCVPRTTRPGTPAAGGRSSRRPPASRSACSTCRGRSSCRSTPTRRSASRTRSSRAPAT